MAKKIMIDKHFMTICDKVLALERTITQWVEEWKKCQDYSLFHSEIYEGCFVPESGKFSFSTMNDTSDEHEYLFVLSLDQIKEIQKGEIKFVWGITMEEYWSNPKQLENSHS